MKYLIFVLMLTSCAHIPEHRHTEAQDRCAELMELAIDNGVDVPTCEEN